MASNNGHSISETSGWHINRKHCIEDSVLDLTWATNVSYASRQEDLKSME